MLVAEITRDHLNEKYSDMESVVGKEFDYEAMIQWWGWDDLPDTGSWLTNEQTKFKLYDDDGELYYEGWLHDDDEAIVQQFVLAWAKADSGCTEILVLKDGKYVQEIG